MGHLSLSFGGDHQSAALAVFVPADAGPTAKEDLPGRPELGIEQGAIAALARLFSSASPKIVCMASPPD